MTLRSLLLACSGFVLVPAISPGAATDELQQLKAQLQQMRDDFDRVRREQQQQIDLLTRRLEQYASASSAASLSAPPPAPAEEQRRLETELAGALAATSTASTTPPAPASSSPPAGRLSLVRGSSYVNLGFTTQAVAGWSTESDPSAQLQLGDHDPLKRGFSLRNAEIALDGAVDPYFKGFANIALKLDADNETDIELEETFLETTALPANLQVRAGQYFARFGRHNPQHPHAWAFVDQPLVLNRALGPDGLRSIGTQVSWLAPTPGYTEVLLSVMDGQGGTAFSFRNAGEPDDSGVNRYAGRATVDRPLHGFGDLLLVPRIETSFELSDTQTLVAGVSGAFGPNATGPDARTEIYGVDVLWKWKAAQAARGVPYVAWQTEAVTRRFDAAADSLAPEPLPDEKLTDSGVYSQIVYGFAPRWNVGVRGEYVSGDDGLLAESDPFRGERTRFSPQLTFLPSEFSKIRLQYNYDDGAAFGTAHSVWLQFEFSLGAHAAHRF